MFSRGEVDALFNETLRLSQRSLLLLSERTRGSSAQPPPQHQRHLQSSLAAPSLGFAVTVQELRTLANFSAFVDAAGTVCQRVQQESKQPSTAMQRRRRSGAAYPLLGRVVEGLAGVRYTWKGCVDELSSGRASLTLLLIRAALFVDWAHGSIRATDALTMVLHTMEHKSVAPSHEELRREVEPLLLLLRKVTEGMPEELVDEFDTEVLRVICTLPSSSAQGASSIAPLSSLLLFPGLIPYVALNASRKFAAVYIVASIDNIATGLLQVYLRKNDVEFCRTCRALIQHAVLTGACVEEGAALVGEWRKGIGFMKLLFDTLLVSVERCFTVNATPCSGMTELFCGAFVKPLRGLVQSWMASRKCMSTDVPADEYHTFSHVWCTASYRALVVVESLAHAELGVVSGCGSATSQQRRYNTMLQQSRGKITTAILSAVTEDRLLLFEETTTRSGQGHKVFRICDGGLTPVAGGGSGPCVFVYIDNGTIYMKIGRERAFRRANSVEEVFSVFAAQAPKFT